VEIGRCQCINLRVPEIYISSDVGIRRTGYKERINLPTNSRWCHTLLKNNPKLLCSICPETFIFEVHVRVKCINIPLSSVIFHEDKSAFLGVLKKQCLHQVSVVIEWAWHTHHEYCDMPFPFGVCNGRLPLMHDNTSYVILVDVIQTLLCFDDWSSVSVRHKV
jgi:hypothetical protein